MESEETGTTKRGRGRGRAARGRGTSTRARGRGRGRGRKAKVIESDDEASPEQPDTEDVDASIEEKPQEIEAVAIVPPPIDTATEEKENEIIPPTSKLNQKWKFKSQNLKFIDHILLTNFESKFFL